MSLASYALIDRAAESLAEEARREVLRIIAAGTWNEADHPRNAKGEFATKGGAAAKVAPLGHQQKLARAGYRLNDVRPSTDEWVDQRGNKVLVKAYAGGNPKYPHQVKLEGFGPGGNRFYKGHQINKLVEVHNDLMGKPPALPAAPAKKPAQAAPAKAAPQVPVKVADPLGVDRQAFKLVGPKGYKALTDAGFVVKNAGQRPLPGMQPEYAIFGNKDGTVQVQVVQGGKGYRIYKDNQLGPTVAHRVYGADGNLRGDITWAITAHPAGYTQPKMVPVPSKVMSQARTNLLKGVGFQYMGAGQQAMWGNNKFAWFRQPGQNGQPPTDLFVTRWSGTLYKGGKEALQGDVFGSDKQYQPYIKSAMKQAMGLPVPQFNKADDQKTYEAQIAKSNRDAYEQAGFQLDKVERNSAGDATFTLTHPSGVQLKLTPGGGLEVYKNGNAVPIPAGVYRWGPLDKFGNIAGPIRKLIGMPDPDLKKPTAFPATYKDVPNYNLIRRGAHETLVANGFKYAGAGRDKDGDEYVKYDGPNGTVLRGNQSTIFTAHDKDGKKIWQGASLYGANNIGNDYLDPGLRKAAGIPLPKFANDKQAAYESIADDAKRKALDLGGFKLDRVEFNEQEEPTAILKRGSGTEIRVDNQNFSVFKGGQEVHNGYMGTLVDNFGYLNKNIRQAVGLPEPDLRIPTNFPRSQNQTEPPYEYVRTSTHNALVAAGFKYAGTGRDKKGRGYAKYDAPNGGALRGNRNEWFIGYDKDGKEIGKWVVLVNKNALGNQYVVSDVKKAFGIPMPKFAGNPQQQFETMTSDAERKAFDLGGFKLDRVELNDKEEPTAVLTHPNGVEIKLDNDYANVFKGGKNVLQTPRYSAVDNFGFLNKPIRQEVGLPDPDLRKPVNPNRPQGRYITGGMKDALTKANFKYAGVGRDKDGNEFDEYTHPSGVKIRKNSDGNYFVVSQSGKEVPLKDGHPYERDKNGQPQLKMAVKLAAGLPGWELAPPATASMPGKPASTPAKESTARPAPPPEDVQPNLPMTWPPKGVYVNPYAKREMALVAGQKKDRIGHLGGIGGSKHDMMDNGIEVQWKPKDGENKGAAGSYNVTWGEQAIRETAAYKVALDVDMENWVTPTVVRDKNSLYDGAEGCLREWSKDYEPAGSAQARAGKTVYDGNGGISRVAAFDYVIGNGDRHRGNWMYNPGDDHILMIDHGYAFPNATRGSWNNTEMLDRAQSQFDSRPDGKYSPREMAIPFVKNKKDIINDLAKLGINPDAIKGVSERIDDLAKTSKWSDLTYR